MKKKSVELRALEMAVRHLTMLEAECQTQYCPLVGQDMPCMSPKFPNGASDKDCRLAIAAHFLSLAKKEMDKEAK